MSSSPARRCFGHGPQGRARLLVSATGERDEAGGGQDSLLDRHVGLLLKQAQKPARRYPRVPARIFARDEHPQLERVGEAQLRKVFRRGQRRERVPARQCPLEDRVRVALRGRTLPSRDQAGGPPTLSVRLRQL